MFIDLSVKINFIIWNFCLFYRKKPVLDTLSWFSGLTSVHMCLVRKGEWWIFSAVLPQRNDCNIGISVCLSCLRYCSIHSFILSFCCGTAMLVCLEFHHRALFGGSPGTESTIFCASRQCICVFNACTMPPVICDMPSYNCFLLFEKVKDFIYYSEEI
jgi:hypothetical protein